MTDSPWAYFCVVLRRRLVVLVLWTVKSYDVDKVSVGIGRRGRDDGQTAFGRGDCSREPGTHRRDPAGHSPVGGAAVPSPALDGDRVRGGRLLRDSHARRHRAAR